MNRVPRRTGEAVFIKVTNGPGPGLPNAISMASGLMILMSPTFLQWVSRV